jgi:hypothetical protein
MLNSKILTVIIHYTFLIMILTTFQSKMFSRNFVSADNPNIQYFGRWDFSDPKASAHAWPGVYICANFEGTSIGVRMNDNYCYYNVFIDNNFVKIFHPDSNGITDYQLISNLEDKNHSIKITKRNETMESKFSFYGFILDEGKSLLVPDQKPIRKIEFIGDSFTSAQGNEYTKEDKPGEDAPITNIYDGFGPIIARYFDAQYHITSRSGFGLVCDWQGNPMENLPNIFDRTILFQEIPKWNFENWKPDIVVIGLGLNDYSGFDGWNNQVSKENENRFKSAYHKFISRIRENYPGVMIIAVAPHVDWLQYTISKIVGEEKAAVHNDVYYTFYPYFEGGYVYGGHPTVETHKKIAEKIINEINSIGIWN